VDIGGHLGFYNPVGSLVQAPASATQSVAIEKRLQGSALVGVNAVAWVSSRLGFAGDVAYAPSRVAVIQPGFVADRDASVLLGSARVLFALTPHEIGPGVATGFDSPWVYYVGAGGGLASRSGGVWSYSSGLTSPALVLNAGVQTLSGPRVVLRLELADYISRAQFDAGAPGETPARMHHDLAISLSLAFRAVKGH
jgi:hypothetical protein